MHSRTVARLSVLATLVFALGCKPGRVAHPELALPPALAEAKRVKLRHLRFSTDKEKLQWERAIEAVWRTPLGEMYSEYLFAPTEDHADLPLWARMVTERIFREVRFLTIRLAALQVMDDDLYVREQMTADVNDRITILQGHIGQERTRLNQLENDTLIPQVSAALLVAIPVGSSVVRNKMVDAGRQILRLPPKQRPVSVLSPLKIAGRQAISVANAATWIWLFFSVAEWLRQDWYYQSDFAPKDEVMLLSLDDLVTSLNLSRSGKAHMQFPLAKPKSRPAPGP